MGHDGGETIVQHCSSGRRDKSATTTATLPCWRQVAKESGFCPRDTAEGVVFDDTMWLSNGYCDGGVLARDLWRSSDGVTWELVSDNTPYDGYAEMVVYEDRVWAVKDSVWSSVDGVTWNQTSPTTPFGVRGYGELVVFGGRMWQLGSGADVWHTADGVHWDCACADAPYGNRFGPGVAVYHGNLWLLGGAVQQASDPPEKSYPEFTTHNDVWCSADGSNWMRVLEHAPWAERMWSVATVHGGKLWLLGGFSNREHVNFAEAWHSEDGMTWQACNDPMFSPRHEVTPYVFEGSLWVVAGNAWPLVNDVWRLDLLEGT